MLLRHQSRHCVRLVQTDPLFSTPHSCYRTISQYAERIGTLPRCVPLYLQRSEEHLCQRLRSFLSFGFPPLHMPQRLLYYLRSGWMSLHLRQQQCFVAKLRLGWPWSRHWGLRTCLNIHLPTRCDRAADYMPPFRWIYTPGIYCPGSYLQLYIF